MPDFRTSEFPSEESSLLIDRLIDKTKRTFSPEVVEYAKQNLQSDGSNWKDLATRMGYKIENPDYLDLAGAMLVELMKTYGPESIFEYIKVMKERLDPNVKSFMENHATQLTELMKRFEFRDYAFNFFSAMNLYAVYLARPSYDEDVFETPSYFYLRVVVGLFFDWKEGDPLACEILGHHENTDKPNSIHWVEKVYEETVFHRISFATPTLFSSGFNKSQKASCFLLQVGDNLEEILEAVQKMGQISKYKGGIGVDISQIRHSNIGSVGISSGTRNLILMYDKLIRYVDQTGVRKGSATVFQRPHHPDVIDFTTIIDKEERGNQESAPNIDNAFWLNWMFFKRVRGDKGGKWTLFCPAKAPSLNNLYGEDFIKEYEKLEELFETWKGKENIIKEYIRGSRGKYREKLIEEYKHTINELELSDLTNRIYGVPSDHEKEYYRFLLGLVRFTKQVHVDDILDKIFDMQKKFGKPYLLNGDAANFKSNQKNLGYIRCSNLCQEIFEYTSKDEVACCNLGSLVLGKYIKELDGQKFVDYKLLASNTRMMVTVLNRVIDSNYYPLEEAKRSNLRHRPIGLGVCGWGDLLNELRVAPDDNQAYELNKKIAACIYFNAVTASSYLGYKQGNYSTFQGSPMSEGHFQFNLWLLEHNTLKRLGILNEKVRKWEDQLPIDPEQWGQPSLTFDGLGQVEPCWESLRTYTSKFMRNSLLIARMPTASSASLVGTTESVEIHSANIYSRNVLAVSAPIINKYMIKDLKEIGLWNSDVADFIRCCDGSISKLHVFAEKFPQKVPLYSTKHADKLKTYQHLYRTIWEISQKVFIEQAAHAGIYICQGHSFNLWIPDPTTKQLKAAMLMSADIGLKTLNYYVRRLPAIKPNPSTVLPEIAELGIKMREELYFSRSQKKRIEEKEKVEQIEKEENFGVCRMEEGCLYCTS